MADRILGSGYRKTVILNAVKDPFARFFATLRMKALFSYVTTLLGPLFCEGSDWFFSALHILNVNGGIKKKPDSCAMTEKQETGKSRMIQLTHAQVVYKTGSAAHRLKAALLYSGAKEKTALEDITLWLGKGEAWVLVGKAGAGKTTLLRLCAGQIPLNNGSCTVAGVARAALREKHGLFLKDTGAGNVKLACQAEGMNTADTKERVENVARMSCLGEKFHKPLTGYDETMLARLLLSIALCAQPDVLLVSELLECCDKPFLQQTLLELCKRRRAGMTLILECADPLLCARVCENALWLENGRVKKLGPWAEIMREFTRPPARVFSSTAQAERADAQAQQAKIDRAKKYLSAQKTAVSRALGVKEKEK